MTTLPESLATWCATAGLGGGDPIYPGFPPEAKNDRDEPTGYLSLAPYGGQPHPDVPISSYNIQATVCHREAGTAWERAEALVAAVHRQAYWHIEGYTVLRSIAALPVLLENDEHGRAVVAVNMRLDVRAES